MVNAICNAGCAYEAIFHHHIFINEAAKFSFHTKGTHTHARTQKNIHMQYTRNNFSLHDFFLLLHTLSLARSLYLIYFRIYTCIYMYLYMCAWCCRRFHFVISFSSLVSSFLFFSFSLIIFFLEHTHTHMYTYTHERA